MWFTRTMVFTPAPPTNETLLETLTMTQLMLFEATSNTSPSPYIAGAAVDYARTVNLSSSPMSSSPMSSSPMSSSPMSSSPMSGYPETPQTGVNRMGDLARLVLMRYDLLARRRAEIAARHAS
jgi:hypothetical protein